MFTMACIMLLCAYFQGSLPRFCLEKRNEKEKNAEELYNTQTWIDFFFPYTHRLCGCVQQWVFFVLFVSDILSSLGTKTFDISTNRTMIKSKAHEQKRNAYIKSSRKWCMTQRGTKWSSVQ
jgi:hypothetical protein